MLKIYCLGEHRVCQVGEAFHEQYWIPFEALATPLPPHLFASLYYSELCIDSRSLCVLWTPSRSLKESHKKTFYWARLLWWVCHFVQCTKPSWGDSLVCLTSQTGWWVWIEPHRARRSAPKNEQTLSPAHMLAIACLVVVGISHLDRLDTPVLIFLVHCGYRVMLNLYTC